MAQDLIDKAIEQMQAQRFGEALPLLRRAIEADPSQWNAWYMAGQCCRFLNDIDGAIAHLGRAAELKRDEAPVFLALGIAHQLRSQWADAVEAFRQAITIAPDYELAYNSLALTQKKAGALDKALHNYDAGAKALARRLVKATRNGRNSPILKHRDTAGTLWIEHAMYAGLYLASSANGISGIAWPTGEQAMEEERTEEHAGLYWVDLPQQQGETTRLFLPNYFNTFRESLRHDAAYANLIGNRGTVLELLGRHDEARQHFDEATEFQP
jgi:tetratricopeptide (TPR) repeat protein